MPNLEHSSAWRTLGAEERMAFYTWTIRKLQSREQKGVGKYGLVFRGDPLDHLEEELLDALLYVYQEKRRQDRLGSDGKGLTTKGDTV